MAIMIRPFEECDIRAMASIRAQEWETEAYWERRIGLYLRGEHSPRQLWQFVRHLLPWTKEGLWDLLPGTVRDVISVMENWNGSVSIWRSAGKESRANCYAKLQTGSLSGNYFECAWISTLIMLRDALSMRSTVPNHLGSIGWFGKTCVP